jgi:uncharacterized protein
MQQPTLQTLPMYVKDTGTPKGRGVFAARNIEQGEVIEVCHVVQLITPFLELPVELQRMVFDWESMAKIENMCVLALGFGSLYNHDNPANANCTAGADATTLIISAHRSIEQHEEITINYSGPPGEAISEEDSWFIGNGVDLYVPPAEGSDNLKKSLLSQILRWKKSSLP